MSYVHIKYEYMRVEVPGFFAVMLLLARGVGGQCNSIV